MQQAATRAIASGLLMGLAIAPVKAQSATTAGKLEFDVASVKPNKPDDQPHSNFPLGPGNVFTPTGAPTGIFSAGGLPLITYIAFAYKIMGNQEQALVAQLPSWVMTDHFDIQARAEGNPTKDQMRLMMRSLLAERFKLSIRAETRQVPVFGLVVLKAGKTGPRLQPHPDDPLCSAVPPPPPTQVIGQFPALCGGLLPLPTSAPGLQNAGARNVTMTFLANQLTAMGRLDRPVLDQTGLMGTFDFSLEWVPDPSGPQAPGPDLQADPGGAGFLTAVREQLGLKLEPQKGPVDVLVVDHVEHPSEN